MRRTCAAKRSGISGIRAATLTITALVYTFGGYLMITSLLTANSWGMMLYAAVYASIFSTFGWAVYSLGKRKKPEYAYLPVETNPRSVSSYFASKEDSENHPYR